MNALETAKAIINNLLNTFEGAPATTESISSYSAAEKWLAQIEQPDQSSDLREQIQAVINSGIENGESAYWIADDLMERFTIAQMREQPQATPTNHISAHPPAPSAEVQELRNTAADWQKQFHQLESLCNQRGLTVGYGDHGQVTLSEEPKQQLPGEDPPFDACRCPACVAIRATVRIKQYEL